MQRFESEKVFEVIPEICSNFQLKWTFLHFLTDLKKKEDRFYYICFLFQFQINRQISTEFDVYIFFFTWKALPSG